jgi:cold shock CspA family protein
MRASGPALQPELAPNSILEAAGSCMRIGSALCTTGDLWMNESRGRNFIHISVVEKAGIRVLAERQRVAMQVVKTQKGREAISLTLMG